jgi:uncharacterized HAD superfamily protein
MTTLRELLIAPGNKAIDIDDTFIPLKEHVVPAINNYFGRRLNRPFRDQDYVWLGLEQSKLFVESGITKEDKLKLFRYMEHTGIIENILPYIYAVATSNVLSKYGEIILLTSRANGFYDDAIGMTDRWVKNVQKSNKYFVSPRIIYNHNKHQVLKENNITVLFDDNAVFSLNVLKESVPVVAFTQSWNRLGFNDINLITKEAYEEKVAILNELNKYNNKNLYRINNWLEVFKELK